MNITQKIFSKKYNNKKSLEKLLIKKKYFEFDFQDYEPLIFFGTRTFHLNRNLDEKNDTHRLTFLSHYFDISSNFGIGNLMRIIRKKINYLKILI